MKLPKALRDELKAPLGVLIPDTQVTDATISAYTHDTSYIITVGDKTTEKLIEFGIVPNLQIVDNYEKRSFRGSPRIPVGTIPVMCSNPAAQITDESIAKIKDAFSSKTPIRLTVDGEEDLLVLPVCVHAPKNAIVFYGQPNKGMVVVYIDDAIRHKTQRLLDLMVGE